MIPNRWCTVCRRPMKDYKGRNYGIHGSCKPRKPGQYSGTREWKDDPPALIEEKFQAALVEVRRVGVRAEEMAWPSSLTRRIL